MGNTIQARPSPGGANVRFVGLGADNINKAGLWTISGNLIGSQITNIHIRYCRGIVISGNSIYSGHGRNIVVEHSGYITVGPNSFDYNPGYRAEQLVTLGDGVVFDHCFGCNLTGAVLSDTRAGTAEQGGAVEIRHSRAIAVTACQIINPRHRGIEMTDVEACRVSGCTIRAEPGSSMQQAIRLTGGSGNMIDHNMVSAGRAGDIVVAAADQARLIGNVTI